MARSAVRLRPEAVRQLDPNDPFEGLSSTQHLFVTLSFSGLSDMEAYRQAYGVQGAEWQSIAHKVASVANHPLVVAKLKSLVQRRDEQATLVSFLSREWIANGIAELARHADKDSTRLNAYVALGKMSGIDMFRDTVRHENVTRTVEDTERDLVAAIERARASLTIEATPNTQADKPRDRRRKPTK